MRFELHQIEVPIFLGPTPKEHKVRQNILISLSYDYDTWKAGNSDELSDTIDYFEIRRFIMCFPGNRKFSLLEFLHQELSNALMGKFPKLKNINLTIEKFPFESGSVSISNK